MTTVPGDVSPQARAKATAGARVDVLAYPSATTTRFAITVTALLTAGLFIGSWLHNVSPQNDTWTSTVAACGSTRSGVATSGSLEASLAAHAAFTECTSNVERIRASYAAVGGLTVALSGVLGLYAAPLVLRRQRRLRQPGPALQPMVHRFGQLAAEAKVPAPALLVGSSRSRDGFTYGVPGRYQVVVPPAVAVRWNRSGQFDALARHELAHVRHHDVVVAWLTKGLLYAVVPMLSVPVVYGLVTADLSLLPAYGWRAVLLATVAVLIANATLRAREHDADLRAAESPDAEADLLELLNALPAPAPMRRWRSLMAHHPSPQDRLLVLRDPSRVAPVTFLDTFAAAFLAALSLPLLVLVLSAALTGTEHLKLATGGAGTIAGTLLGATLGLGLWRQCLVARVSGARAQLLPASAGVALGLVLGQAASLAQSGSPLVFGLERPAVVLVTALTGMGAVALLAGLGELWADAAPRLRRARTSWLIAIGIGAGLYSVVLTYATSLQEALDRLDGLVARGVLIAALGAWPPATAALALAVVAAVALVRAHGGPAPAPSWLVPVDYLVPWPAPPSGRREAAYAGVAAGTAGGSVLVASRLLAGPPGTADETQTAYFAVLWLAAAVGAAAAVGLVLLRGRRGAGLSLVAAPVATTVAVIVALTLSTVLGGTVTLAFVEAVLRPSLGLGFGLLMLAALLGLPGSQAVKQRGRTALLAVTISVLAAAAAGGVMSARAQLVPSPEVTVPVVQERLDQIGSELDQMTYIDSVAVDLIERYLTIEEEVSRMAAGDDAALAADQLVSGPMSDLRELLHDAETLLLRSQEARTLHGRFVAALEVRIESLETIHRAVVHGDPTLLSHGQTLTKQAKDQFMTYVREVLALRER